MMRWEELNRDGFADAVKECEQVCLLPISAIEPHGPHLPVGTDMYQGREVCRRAAEIEPAIIFPDYIFGQINEARHVPGTIALSGQLTLRLLDSVCTEIARNGLTKVVVVNCHGGNIGLLSFFNMLQLDRQRDYVVYVVQPISAAFSAQVDLPWERSTDFHAGAGETSMMQATRPDLVDMSKVPADDEGRARNHLKGLREAGVQTGVWWYADFPTHYAGYAKNASAEVGEQILEAAAQDLARSIRAIKEDTETRRLLGEFYDSSRAPWRNRSVARPSESST